MPADSELYTLVKGIEDFEVLVTGQPLQLSSSNSDILSQVSERMKSYQGMPLEQALRVVIDYKADLEQNSEVKIAESIAGAFHIFMQLESVADQENFLIDNETIPALLDKLECSKQFEYLQALLVGSRGEAQTFTEEFIGDMIESSYYDAASELSSTRELTNIVNALVLSINQQKIAMLDQDKETKDDN